MKKTVYLFLPVTLALHSTRAGTIPGTVRAEGKIEVPNCDTSGGAYASRNDKFTEELGHAEMRDLVPGINTPPILTK